MKNFCNGYPLVQADKVNNEAEYFEQIIICFYSWSENCNSGFYIVQAEKVEYNLKSVKNIK